MVDRVAPTEAAARVGLGQRVWARDGMTILREDPDDPIELCINPFPDYGAKQADVDDLGEPCDQGAGVLRSDAGAGKRANEAFWHRIEPQRDLDELGPRIVPRAKAVLVDRRIPP